MLVIHQHIYDHCPFCIRVELFLSRNNISYSRVVYGYGAGAPPSKKGYDPTGGPVKLLGEKLLPVLEINGSLYGESLDIIGRLQTLPSIPSIPCASSPTRLNEWKKIFSPLKSALVRPRIVKLKHLKDWEDERDVGYAREKYRNMGFDYEDGE